MTGPTSQPTHAPAAGASLPWRCADLHCHSDASNKAAEAALNAIHCPECYSRPEEVYAQAKRRGMDFVTITDHDSVDGVLRIVEKHADGYVAYPLGLKGVVVGEGDSYEQAMADVTSAIRFHIQTFGKEVLQAGSPVLEAFVAEAEVTM